MAEEEPPKEYLSPEELISLLEDFSAADFVRLKRIATRFADGTEMNADDLFQEACCKFLEGDRKCPRTHDFIVVLVGAMRSIAWATREQRRTNPLSGSVDLEENSINAIGQNPEEIISAKRDLKAMQQDLLDLFNDDEEVQFVLLAQFLESDPSEIREQLELDITAYATTLRRIRRKIDKAYPEGWNK